MAANNCTEEDLVLSVLRSPVRRRYEHASSCEDSEYEEEEDEEDTADQKCLPLVYQSAEIVRSNQKINTDTNGSASSENTGTGGGFVFLRRFKRGRFGEAHHKRVPTPIKRKNNNPDQRGNV
jgi:hypothetical protein